MQTKALPQWHSGVNCEVAKVALAITHFYVFIKEEREEGRAGLAAHKWKFNQEHCIPKAEQVKQLRSERFAHTPQKCLSCEY